MTIDNGKDLLELVVKAADDKLAKDIIAMDVSNLTPLADYFVVMHGDNDRQIKAILDSIIEKCHENNVPIVNIEGKESNKWILLDINAVIVHIFAPEERAYYNLEKLWRDAETVSIEEYIS